MAQWGREPAVGDTPPTPGIDVLEGARLFPGVILSRGTETHRGGQLLLTDDFQLVPASWCRMDGRFTLPEDVDRAAMPECLPGDHLFLGSIHAHFGHCVLEGLARAWAFAAFDAAHPTGLCLVYERTLPDFARDLLARAGIPRDRIRTLDRPVRVERLHVPGPAQRTHRWIAPQMIGVWQAVGQSVDDGDPAGARTWLSRRHVAHRSLVNEAEVEAVFVAAGFDIVHPETLNLTDQLQIARRSSMLAGCVGSQMYLSVFQRPGGSTLVMAPSNFFYADDALIADALDRRLAVAFGSPIRYRDPASTWSIDPAAATALIEAAS